MAQIAQYDIDDAEAFRNNALWARSRGWFDYANTCEEMAHQVERHGKVIMSLRGATYGRDPNRDTATQ